MSQGVSCSLWSFQRCLKTVEWRLKAFQDVSNRFMVFQEIPEAFKESQGDPESFQGISRSFSTNQESSGRSGGFRSNAMFLGV